MKGIHEIISKFCVMVNMKKEDCWYIGIIKKSTKQDCPFFLDEKKRDITILKLKQRYWAADPFCISFKNENYLFYELFDKYRHKGLIAFSKIENDEITKPKIILDEKYHLSFPNIFKLNDVFYMIPETSGSQSIKLFKATRFPDKWIEVKTIRDNCSSVDTIILEDSNKKYLITSDTVKGSPCLVTNYMFEVDNEFEILKSYKLTTGNDGNRNGGNIVNIDNYKYRVGQICLKRYGEGLKIYKIESLNPYTEKLELTLDCNNIKNHINDLNIEFIGLHTYNVSEKYEVIDFLCEEELPLYIRIIRFIYKGYGYIKRRIIKYVFGRRDYKN